MAEVFANSEDPDQRPRSVASDLGLHYSPNTLLGVFRLQWVNRRRGKAVTLFSVKIVAGIAFIVVLLSIQRKNFFFFFFFLC